MRKESELRRNLQKSNWDAFLATPFILLSTPGNVFIASLLTGVFALNESAYGLISSMPFWSNAVQAIVTPLLSQKLSPYMVIRIGLWGQIFLWALIALAFPWLGGLDPKLMTWCFALAIGCSSLLGAAGGTTWAAWTTEWMPVAIRGNYLGRRNRVVGLVNVCFLILGGQLLEMLGASILGYQLIFIASVLMRVGSLLYLESIFKSIPDNPRDTVPVLHRIKTLGQYRGLWLFIAFGMAQGFLFNTCNPFVSVFMLEELAMSLPMITGLIVIASLSSAFAMGIMGKIADRHGSKTLLMVSLVCWQTTDLLWGVMNPGPVRWLLIPLWLSGGFFSAGFFLNYYTLLLKIIPRDAKVVALSAHLALTSLAAAIAPNLSGNLLDWVKTTDFPLLTAYHILFTAKAIALIGAPLIILQMKEPKVTQSTNLIGGLRAIRLAVGAQVIQATQPMYFWRLRKK